MMFSKWSNDDALVVDNTVNYSHSVPLTVGFRLIDLSIKLKNTETYNDRGKGLDKTPREL